MSLKKQIPDYPNYFINENGDVFSDNFNGFIKPFIHKDGYLIAKLHHNKKRKNYRIHRLVAEAFLPNPHMKPQVNHMDGNPSNNRLENL